MKNEHDKSDGMTPVNESRRRLTKAGLAIPAVLGTLASKPVLANVPWKCTISGQVSGNVSGHESEVCTSQGTSHATLITNYISITSKLSDLFPGLTVYFRWKSSSGTLKNNTDTNKPEATIYQILDNPAPSGLDYAQKAVVLLLNAKSIQDTNLYPLTEYQAKLLYIAAATGGAFNDTNPTVSWTNAQVEYYIDLLYH